MKLQKASQAFINKFYQPYMEKMQYSNLILENMGEIKKMTRKDALTNFYLKKKDKDIKKIAHDLIIYNNPSKINI